MTKPNILVVEDEELMRTILRQLLCDAGYSVLTADSAETAIELFARNEIAVTLTDIKMAGADGLQLLDQIKSLEAEAVVIVMTAYSSVDTAVAALRKGAYDYVTKPFVNEDLLQTVKNAATQRQLFYENRVLRREIKKKYNFAEIIGKSDAIQNVFELVDKVANTNASVLIQGESGTGKELIARSLHFSSGRTDGPFLAINCGALPESLLESELFGHVKGAFTGAVNESKGMFRSASGGTLLLDEIGEMSSVLQVKLLRALQEHEVTPVGSSIAKPFDARIIAATNKDLETEVSEGRFREDLYYRLNVLQITVPPLRDRREDIPLLVRHFVGKTTNSKDAVGISVSKEAISALSAYDWPGNVRELENAIERAAILCTGVITVGDLPPKIAAAAAGSFETRDPDGFRPTLEEMERRYVAEILTSVGEDKAKTAEILGIDLSTLYRKLKRYDEL